MTSLILRNIAVTQEFLPEEFKNGWRLESISDQIWDVFQDEYKSDLKLKSWAMQYFTAMLKTLLVDYLPKYGD